MTITPNQLWAVTQLGDAATVLYQSSLNGRAVIKRAVFTNTDTVTRNLTVYLVPNSGSPGADNIIIDAYPISPGQDYSPQSLLNMVLGVGNSLQALCDTPDVINTYGAGFTQ